jgi:hypothetical protein
MRETILQAERMLPHRNVFGQAGGVVLIATTINVSKTPYSVGSDDSEAGHVEPPETHSRIPSTPFTGLDLW